MTLDHNLPASSLLSAGIAGTPHSSCRYTESSSGPQGKDLGSGCHDPWFSIRSWLEVRHRAGEGKEAAATGLGRGGWRMDSLLEMFRSWPVGQKVTSRFKNLPTLELKIPPIPGINPSSVLGIPPTSTLENSAPKELYYIKPVSFSVQCCFSSEQRQPPSFVSTNKSLV